MKPIATSLTEALVVPEHAVVTIIGGGGKTSLMFALAREGESAGRRVVTTTTTKMLLPTPEQSRRCVIAARDEELRTLLVEELERSRHVTVGLGKSDDKIESISTEMVESIRESGLVDWILVEGDGAKHRHLKAPRANEPVIPPSSELVVPVVGIDLVGRTFTEETVFRPEIVEAISPYRRGDRITISMVYDILFHERGIIHVRPPHSRVVPFVSWVDGDRDLDNARELARRICVERPFGIDRVVLGNADPGCVHEIITPREGNSGP